MHFDFHFGVRSDPSDGVFYFHYCQFNSLVCLCFFSPQPSPEIATFATAEIAIYCTESSVLLLIAKLKSFISETDLFESDYLKIRYPGK